MKNHIKIYCLFIAIVATSSKPATTDKGKVRNKRQYYMGAYPDDDSYLMRELWDKPVGLGFFVNPKGDGDEGETTRTLRDKIAADEGSGGGTAESKRDEISEKPSATVFSAGKKVESNEEQAQLTGELRSSIEKSDKDSQDPGDKKKVRNSVTCQGQKEWIQCDGPYELIKIKDAFWGRDDDKTCTKDEVTHGLRTDKNCVQDAENTLKKVREACDSENVCEVVASDIYFDKTDCPDVHKFLRLKWQCAPSESRIKEPIS